MTALIFTVLSLGVGQSAPSSAPSTSPVSVERIRQALSRPRTRLALQQREPDFVVDITERQRFERIITPLLQFDAGAVKKPRFFSAQPRVGTTPALASIDLLAVGSALKRQIAGARTPRAASANPAVVRAIAEYCAAQPNGGTWIRICMDPSSIR